MRDFMGRWKVLLGFCILVLCLGTIIAADDPKGGTAAAEHAKLDQHIADTLRDVHNKGAELYNNGDRNGCYRMFQGALITVKPLLALHPNLQKEIETGLAAADKQARVDRQAFALHELIEGVRGKLKTSAGTAKPPETKKGTMGMGGGPKAGPKTTEPPKTEPKKTEPAKTEPKKTEPKKTEEKKTEPKKPVAKTLWDRLGGEANVKKIVDDFFALAAPDPKVNATRGGKFKIDEAKAADLKAKTVDIISEGAGGPRKYTGKSLKEVHAAMGITDAEFDVAGAHFAAALKKNAVAQADIDEAMRILGATRKDIVEPKKAEPKKAEEKKPAPALQGKVSLNGKPLAKGAVSFLGATDIYTGAIDKDGKYFIAKLPPGKYAVIVQSEGVAKMFGDRATSGLTYEAVAGNQIFDIELKQ